MTPYGYEIRDARAIIVPEEAERLRTLFVEFIGGSPLKTCAFESGIERTAQTCKSMLGNPIYVGTDFYPQIIEDYMFSAAQAELKRRTEKRKPMVRSKQIIANPVRTVFEIKGTSTIPFTGQQAYAAYQYGRIMPIQPDTPQ